MSINFDNTLFDLSLKDNNYFKLYKRLIESLNIDVFSIDDKLILLSFLSNFKSKNIVNDQNNIYKTLLDDINNDIINKKINKNIDVLLFCHFITMKDSRQLKIAYYGDTIADIPSIDSFKKYGINTIEYVDTGYISNLFYSFNSVDYIPWNSKDYIDLIHCPIYMYDHVTYFDILKNIIKNSYNILRINGILNIPLPKKDIKPDFIINFIKVINEYLIAEKINDKFVVTEYEYNNDTLIFNTRSGLKQMIKSIRLQKNL